MNTQIARERLQHVLAAVPAGRALVLCAPMGMGKTTLLRAFAEGCAVSLYEDGAALRSAGDVRDRLARSAGADWLLIDDVDRADPRAIDELVRAMATDGCGSTRIIVSARSRSALRIGSLAASGRATVLGADDLSFTVDEAARLAEAAGVSFEADDLTELVHVTDGWPLALSWIVRDAADRQPYLVGAFERWSERNAHLMLECVAAENSRDPDVRSRFMAAIEGAHRPAEAVLAELELAGCPVKRSRAGLSPFRLLGRLLLASEEMPRASALLDPLSVTLLGRFQCRIGSRAVVFARRRDLNVLVFLALAPDGRATRAELQKAFWPGLPAAVASQGVRTTLSRLRRAIAAIVGPDVDRYFASRGIVTLDLQFVRVDARRFREHVQCGLSDDASGEKSGRNRHFRAAERIYTGSLLASESIDAALAPRVAEFAGMFDLVVSSLAEERRGANRPFAARAPFEPAPLLGLLGGRGRASA